MAPLTREDHMKISKEMPFLFLLFFLCISISIFYACNLSPASVLHNSVFWFFVSNTLIFIIAADYVAFSPPRQKLVVYLRQEYYQTDIQTKPIVFETPASNHRGVLEEKENPENGLTKNVVKNDPENPNEDSPQKNTVSSEETAKNQENLVDESKPEKVEREEMIEETDQFSKLTDEELNRRVEEFIKKFNTQIRLQNIQEKLQKSETI